MGLKLFNNLNCNMCKYSEKIMSQVFSLIKKPYFHENDILINKNHEFCKVITITDTYFIIYNEDTMEKQYFNIGDQKRFYKSCM